MAHVQRKCPFILHLPIMAIIPGNAIEKKHGFLYSCLGGLEVFILAVMIAAMLADREGMLSAADRILPTTLSITSCIVFTLMQISFQSHARETMLMISQISRKSLNWQRFGK